MYKQVMIEKKSKNSNKDQSVGRNRDSICCEIINKLRVWARGTAQIECTIYVTCMIYKEVNASAING